ncbi:MAG: hypothetical protein COV45_02650 [Deltaproteobacteria bacterium CG11_big_fil_rev_8_21_14_0_20_47_16]|nr:MAG: hypothetical protein COV45_02650 [Deltaproteobacteria bacterium CG11_big_fil_rev_8_21_14_0_20_47_16]
MVTRSAISDHVNSMLQREIGNICPLCGTFEKTGNDFTNHHINHDPSVSEYWNLIKICENCHADLTKHKADGVRLRRIKLVKKKLFRDHFGPEAYKTLKLAYENKLVTATPINAIELVEDGYLIIHTKNVLTAGPATNISTFDTYSITDIGRDIVEKLSIVK